MDPISLGLPHRAPFIFVDSVDELVDPRPAAAGRRRVGGESDAAPFHFVRSSSGQFFIGLDGLNIWLIALTSLMLAATNTYGAPGSNQIGDIAPHTVITTPNVPGFHRSVTVIVCRPSPIGSGARSNVPTKYTLADALSASPGV